MANQEAFHFGDYRLDMDALELRKHGKRVPLRQQATRVLAILVQRSGEVITREELQREVWGTGTFVDFESGLNNCVKQIRDALCDEADRPRYVETIPRRGYRFLARVEIVNGQNGRVNLAEAPASSSPEAGTTAQVLQPEKYETPASKKRWSRAAVAAVLITVMMVTAVVFFLGSRRQRSKPAGGSAWEQITKFSDSATQPALSPDGRMIAFIRGPETFVTPGQIYVKVLPDGEPVQLTHDSLPKMAPVFSPDGSRIAYTTTDRNFNWDTWAAPVLGGESRKLMPNAAALTWPDRQHVLFSEAHGPSNIMAIVIAAESRAEERNVYVPIDWGMAHRSWPSPDGKWVLVSEMDGNGWLPCRVVPFDGSSRGRTVGPHPARCTYGGWSPDSETMYFSADAGDGFHIWSQRFRGGESEQLTFGPTEEEGVAVSPDGRSLVTSAGITESTIWVHDASGDRQISGEGFASVPGLGYGAEKASGSVFSPDGRKLYYLVRKQKSRAQVSGELWSTDLDSGQSEAVLPGISIDASFDIARDGKRVTFQTTDGNGAIHVWVASLDRHTPPQLVTPSVASTPCFGPGERIYFRVRHGDGWLLQVAGSEGSSPVLTMETSAPGFGSVLTEWSSCVSPRGNWWLTWTPTVAHPVKKGLPTRICNFCSVGWGPNGTILYLWWRGVGVSGGGTTIAISLPPDKELPTLPPGGLNSIEDAKGLNVAAEIDMSDKALLAPGPDPTVYAYTRVTVQRNLYRIRLK